MAGAAAIVEIGTAIDRAEASGGVQYLEVLRTSTMRIGVYVLPAGAEDPQSAHAEDEAYYVIRGRAELRTESGTVTVAPGSVLHVPAGVEHRFERITEALRLLVVFSRA